MVSVYVWIAIAAIMALFEMATVQLVSIWFFLGALCAAITAMFTDSIVVQIAVFVLVSVVALVATRPLVKKLKSKKTSTNADRLVGSNGIMLSDLPSRNDVGQVKVRGGQWSARTNAPPIKKGDIVKIIAIDSVKLIVEKNIEGE